MLEINSISPERMNGGAHFMFMTNVVKKAASDPTIKTRAASQLATLQAALEAEDAALKISRKSLLSDDIAAADHLRDRLYRSYRKAVSGFSGFPVPAA